MTDTYGLIIEITANFVQTLIFFGFPFLYLDKPENKLLRHIPFWSMVLFYFSVQNYFTFHEMTFNHLDSLILNILLLIYSLVFLRGKIYLRILIPLIGYATNLIIALGLLYLMSFLGKMTVAEAVTFSTAFRTFYLILAHAIWILVLWIILRIGKKKIRLTDPYDIIAFVLIPILEMIGLFAVLIMYQYLNFDRGAFIYIVITFSVFLILALLFWFLLIKASKVHEAKTDLLLSKQREEMYQQSVLSANDQIEKTSQVKHDIKNSLKSVQELINSGQYEEAARLCSDESEMLSRVYTPVSTSNPTLNAIMNVELDKAYAAGIDFTYNISDTLAELTASEIVSIIGNLCDNAVEYLNTAEQVQKKMSLEISAKKGYKIIKCRNAITGSVLDENPSLSTTKGDKGMHGKGLNILREIAAKYNGELTVNENDGMIEISLILRM